MPSEVTVTRLGRAVPSGRQNTGDGAIHTNRLSSGPIVLWSAHGAPAVLASSIAVTGVFMVGGKVDQKVEILAGGARKLGSGLGSPFPLVNREVETSNHRPELISHVHTADLDGDGEEELIAVYGSGSEGPGTIEVYGAKKKLATWKGTGRGHRHMLQSLQIARIGGKDVVHVVMQRWDDNEEDRKRLRFALLRIDDRGITELRLKDVGFDVDKIGGVGVLSRPGSNKVDELVVALEKVGDEHGIYFSRHAPDGSILAAPRRAEGSAYYGHWMTFLPGRDTTVSFDVQNHQLYAVTPRDPKDWATRFILDRRCPSGGYSDYLGVLDPAGQPKILTHCGEDFFAEDLAGRFLVRSPQGWHPVAPAQPFYKATAPREGQGLEAIVLARDGSAILLVHARRRSVKPLSKEEIIAAAGRYLTEEARKKIEARESIDPKDSYHSREIEEECQRRKIATPIRTIAEWQKAMPDHYEEFRKRSETDHEWALERELTSSLRYGRDKDDQEAIRDRAGHAAWLKSLDLLAETSFTILRDGIAAEQVTIPGAPVGGVMDDNPLSGLVHFQPAARGGTIVLAMSNGEEAEGLDRSDRPERLHLDRGFYQIDWRPAGNAK